MADAARKLPKWQAQQILCQSKYHAKENIFSADFFCLTFKIRLVKYRYKGKKERGNDD